MCKFSTEIVYATEITCHLLLSGTTGGVLSWWMTGLGKVPSTRMVRTSTVCMFVVRVNMLTNH